MSHYICYIGVICDIDTNALYRRQQDIDNMSRLGAISHNVLQPVNAGPTRTTAELIIAERFGVTPEVRTSKLAS